MHPDFAYFMALTNGDPGRIFSTGVMAGRLIGAWRDGVEVTGVMVGTPDHIIVSGIRVPVSAKGLAPVALLSAETTPLMGVCGIQSCSLMVSGGYVAPDGITDEVSVLLWRARDVIELFGQSRLKSLARAMLIAPYDVRGVHHVPDMDAIERREMACLREAREGASLPSPALHGADSLHANESPLNPARNAGKTNGATP